MESFHTLPFDFEEIKEKSLDCFSVTGAVFTQNFGPWTKNQHVDWLSVDFQYGVIIEHDKSGKNIAYAQFELRLLCGGQLTGD